MDKLRDCHTEQGKLEREKYCIISLIYGLWKYSRDELICKTEIESQI